MHSRFAALKTALTCCTLLLAGCGGGSTNMQDLQNFVAEVTARPGGEIEPMPEFQPYEAFTYSAASMRSPFDIPVSASLNAASDPVSLVEPDFDRPKEPLEEYSLGGLSMVGMVSRGNRYVALVQGEDGVVHRVGTGNYIGRNFGRVERVAPTRIEITEIVPSGDGGWVERPRTLALEER